jgi:hypothetical protein
MILHINTRNFFLLLLFFYIVPASASLAAPSFSWPSSCIHDENCWIVNYIDTAPEIGVATDYKCGQRSYDNHHGTDIAIKDLVEMEKGVDVLAADAGTVLRVRDNMEDRVKTDKERELLLSENKGCGNGVYLDHGQGWQTIYCHLKKDSVKVRPGQKIKKGQKIGEIGLSGASEFAHLHFGVFGDGKTIDPFTGLEDTQGCEASGTSMWDQDINTEYMPFSLYAGGFKSSVPDIEALKIDTFTPEYLPLDSKAIVFWAGFFNITKDTITTIKIADPDGRILVDKSFRAPKNRARQFYYTGKKVGELDKGLYKAQIIQTHPKIQTELIRNFTIEAR